MLEEIEKMKLVAFLHGCMTDTQKFWINFLEICIKIIVSLKGKKSIGRKLIVLFFYFLQCTAYMRDSFDSNSTGYFAEKSIGIPKRIGDYRYAM